MNANLEVSTNCAPISGRMKQIKVACGPLWTDSHSSWDVQAASTSFRYCQRSAPRPPTTIRNISKAHRWRNSKDQTKALSKKPLGPSVPSTPRHATPQSSLPRTKYNKQAPQPHHQATKRRKYTSYLPKQVNSQAPAQSHLPPCQQGGPRREYKLK